MGDADRDGLLQELLLEKNAKPVPPLHPGDTERARAQRRAALARDWRDGMTNEETPNDHV